ncbi:hypothetical protein JK163_01265 [Levilactobacillus brevis]|uniref:hypothetical protein n=1 Tax=Levilactobacillus brevis TaxID=1580 RepID=UPI001BA6B4E5|nr:hypothetical protein [Levilactobacillus brevis]MBS1004950.1 hypothetical protein [Levilactobacillus brevis]
MTSDDAFKRSGFWHGFSTVGKRVVLNWSLYTAIALTSLGVLLLSGYGGVSKLHKVMSNRAVDLFSCSIGAISMILAAIAIAVVIYNKKDLHLIVLGDRVSAEGFVFPYRYGATLWGILALVSFFSELLPETNNYSMFYSSNVLWLFLTIYCVCFTLYLIGEVIQHMLLSAMIEEK